MSLDGVEEKANWLHRTVARYANDSLPEVLLDRRFEPVIIDLDFETSKT